MLRRLAPLLFAALVSVPTVPVGTWTPQAAVAAESAAPRSCVARENPYEIADDFISRCRRASIRQEFPSEYLTWNLGAIDRDRTANGRKAWKLLNDSRFAR